MKTAKISKETEQLRKKDEQFPANNLLETPKCERHIRFSDETLLNFERAGWTLEDSDGTAFKRQREWLLHEGKSRQSYLDEIVLKIGELRSDDRRYLRPSGILSKATSDAHPEAKKVPGGKTVAEWQGFETKKFKNEQIRLPGKDDWECVGFECEERWGPRLKLCKQCGGLLILKRNTRQTSHDECKRERLSQQKLAWQRSPKNRGQTNARRRSKYQKDLGVKVRSYRRSAG